RLWPPFIGAVIDACLKHQARLVFFDNVYMYDKAAIPFMSEGAAVVPPCGKGKVRAQVRAMILEAVEKRGLTALIARAADFYGPENRNSLLEIMVAQNLRKGKKAQAFGDPGRIHTFTYTPDAARATALLGNAPDTWNQEWHVTTTKEKLTMLDWIGLVAKELNTEPKIQKVPVWMVRMLGLFVPVMREFPEMLYQYDRDYLFDSSKIENRFGITATTPVEGIRKMLASNPG
ncbi:MAG TPA: NAD-dependent epimerase/dehydratase family protein, partial [Bacteroidales bacterium]|nr:NAD-dependent epimerase/dehydratase family protein [Bacteroidales bacterium]